MAEITVDHNPKHVHEAGDRYVCIVGSLVGNDADGFDMVWEAYVPAQGSIEAAWRKGLRELDRSDDFNLGVIRDGELVALLWHDEVIETDPAEIARIAEECGL